MLFIAFNVACWLSIFKYGRPGQWKEFFDYDNGNMIVINKDKMMELQNSDKCRFSIICLDEVQEIANAIDYKDPETRFFNKLNQLLRNRGWIIFGTIQEQIVHAKQSRNLYHIVIDMDGPDATEYSVNFSRTFYTSLKSLVNQSSGTKAQRIQYPREKGYKWILGASMLAPPEVRKVYLKLRDDEERKSTQLGMEEIMKARKFKEARYNRVVGTSPKERAIAIINEHPDWDNGTIAQSAGIKDINNISRYRREVGKPLKNYRKPAAVGDTIEAS
jgi:hypothetical protein